MPYIDIDARLRTALVTLILDDYSLLETVQLPLPASERVIASQLAWRLRTEYERSWMWTWSTTGSAMARLVAVRR